MAVAALSEAPAEACARQYGGFVLGDMQLALPMTALREVVACARLSPLPSAARCVLGCVDLRGVAVPVIDLRMLLGKDRDPLPHPCVVIMVHEGRLLGLLAQRVTGVFSCAEDEYRLLTVKTGIHNVMAASIHRRSAASDGHFSVLSPARIAAVHHVPMVEDRAVSAADAVPAGDPAHESSAAQVIPLLLLRCARIAMAIDTRAVHSTFANPEILPSALAMGPCRGTIEHAGVRIPAVDLLALMGLGELQAAQPVHAFVLRSGDGLVAMLVDEVMDVVQARRDTIVHLSTFAMPQPALFEGALPRAAVLAVFDSRSMAGASPAISQYMVINVAALGSTPVVAALASANLSHDGGKSDLAVVREGEHTASARTSVLAFEAVGECVAPLEQIVEILPFVPDAEIFTNEGPLVGFVINRGRSIPLFCLRRLAAGTATMPSAESRVLVVQNGAECLGFVVERVISIESAEWPSAPQSNARAEQGAALDLRSLAKVGPIGAERLRPALDMQALVMRLLAAAAQASASSTSSAARSPDSAAPSMPRLDSAVCSPQK